MDWGIKQAMWTCDATTGHQVIHVIEKRAEILSWRENGCAWSYVVS